MMMISASLLIGLAVGTAEYVPAQPGTEWTYRSAGGSETWTVALRPGSFRNESVLERIESTGARRYERFDPERGLAILSLHLPGGGEIEYERPVVVIPAEVVPGETHRSQARYAIRERGEVRVVGSHYYEVAFEGTASVSTPGGRFEDCLIFQTRAVRLDFSGSKRIEDRREWYARGVGLVKVEGTMVEENAAGERVGASEVSFVLENIER